MKLVDVEIKAAAPGEIAYGVAALQRKIGGRWKTIELYPLRSDKDDQKRTLLLDDNERVVVEARSNLEPMFVNGQNLAIMQPVQVTDSMVEDFANNLATLAAGPLPDGAECQIGVWRVDGDQDWSRTGKRYRIY